RILESSVQPQSCDWSIGWNQQPASFARRQRQRPQRKSQTTSVRTSKEENIMSQTEPVALLRFFNGAGGNQRGFSKKLVRGWTAEPVCVPRRRGSRPFPASLGSAAEIGRAHV